MYKTIAHYQMTSLFNGTFKYFHIMMEIYVISFLIDCDPLAKVSNSNFPAARCAVGGAAANCSVFRVDVIVRDLYIARSRFVNDRAKCIHSAIWRVKNREFRNFHVFFIYTYARRLQTPIMHFVRTKIKKAFLLNQH